MHTPSARELESRHLLNVYGQLDFEPDAASGAFLFAGDRRVADFYGGHAVAALGYGHPRMLAALESQARKMLFQTNAVALEVRARAAERLAAFAPSGLDTVFFANSGAEANENAMRLALRATGRQKIVALEHGFHGRTAAAGAVTWGSSNSWYGFPRTPFDVSFAPRDDAAKLASLIDTDTGAVIVELVQGVAGAYDLAPEFVQALSAACERTGALLIVDEVQTGVGRTGKAFAADHYGLTPSLLTTAKSLGAGYPCSALLMTKEIAAQVSKGDLGTTFGGGPMACALIETVIDVIEHDGLLENVCRLSEMIREACPTGPVKSVQGLGFLLGLVCDRPAAAIQTELLNRGYLVGTSADPAVIRLLPPLTLDAELVQGFLDTLSQLEP
jgi:acetylornithine/succinyldiaminopimelate/putrescine aminotransferase